VAALSTEPPPLDAARPDLVGTSHHDRSSHWSDELVGLMLDGEPALNRTARDWANGVLTALDDMRRHPEAVPRPKRIS
jgi:hypothetical protein